jgi:hypothetical protein
MAVVTPEKREHAMMHYSTYYDTAVVIPVWSYLFGWGSVYVKHLGGKVFTIYVPSFEIMVDEFRVMVEEAGGGSRHTQRLLPPRGPSMDDGRTLSSYCVVAGSTIHLIHNLRHH